MHSSLIQIQLNAAFWFYLILENALQASTKEQDKAATLFDNYKDDHEDHIGPEGASNMNLSLRHGRA